MRNIDVKIVGSVTEDVVIPVQTLDFYSNNWQQVVSKKSQPGGISTCAYGLNILGIKSQLYGYIGSDIISDTFVKEFEERGISTNNLFRHAGRIMEIECYIDPIGKHARLVNRSEENLQKIDFSWEEETFNDKSVVFLNGFACIEFTKFSILKLVEKIENNGSFLIFDPQTAIDLIDVDLLKIICSASNIITSNSSEVSRLFQTIGIAVGNWGNNYLSNKILFLKRGDKGVDIIENGLLYREPPISVDVRNSLGAGDTFNAAIVFGAVNKITSIDVAKLGNVMAGLQVQTLDISYGLPTKNEIISKIIKLYPQFDVNLINKA